MQNIDKTGLIKEFILQDEEKFALAEDIYNSFVKIAKSMLEEILQKIVNNINEKRNLKLEPENLYTLANSYGFDIKINNEYFLRIDSSYYFKTYLFRILHRSGKFDSNNEQMVQFRDSLKSEFPKCSEGDWFILSVQFSDYESNIGNKYLDLFNIYKNKDKSQDNLCDRFNEIFGEKISKIVNIINA